MDLMTRRRAMMQAAAAAAGLQWELIGEKTYELQEYTDTSTSQVIDTGIAIKGTDYAWIMTVITCDTPILTNTEWGMTIAFGSRYTSNGAYSHGCTLQQRGAEPLSFADMKTNATSTGSYGVFVTNNTDKIVFARKAHATGCPKCRAGSYSVKVYVLVSL